jgi:hypothetical protein
VGENRIAITGAGAVAGPEIAEGHGQPGRGRPTKILKIAWLVSIRAGNRFIGGLISKIIVLI